MSELDVIAGSITPPDLMPALKPPAPQPVDQQVALNQSLFGAVDSNPDQAARIAQLSSRTGFAPELVERNFPVISTRDRLDQWQATLADAPRTREWLTNPITAKVAHDAFDDLTLFEHGWNQVKSVFFGAKQGYEASNAAMIALAGETTLANPMNVMSIVLGAAAPGTGAIRPLLHARQQAADPAARAAEIRDSVKASIAAGMRMAEFPVRPAMLDLQKAGNDNDFAGVLRAFLSDPLGIIFDVTAQSVAQLGVGVGATVLGGPAAGIAATGLSSFSQEFLGGVIDNLQEAGVDTRDEAKLTAALSDPKIMAAVLKRAALKAGVVGGADALSMGLAGKTLTPFIKAGLGRHVANTGAQIVTQAALGAGGEALGSVAAGRDVDIGSAFLEGAGELGTLPFEALGMRLHLRAARLAHTVDSMRTEAQRAAAGLQVFDRLMDGVQANPLAARAPGFLADFVGKVTGPDVSVFLPGDTVRDFLQSLPADKAERTAQDWGIAGQLGEALATGGDVVMPLSAYAQHVAATGLHNHFREELRLTATGLTLFEAKHATATLERLTASEGGAIGKDAVELAQALEPARRVFADVERQSLRAGYRPDEARMHAGLAANRYLSRASRMGGDAWTQYRDSGIEIRQVLPESLRAIAPEQLDRLLDAKRGDQPGAVPGASLLEFVARQGGLVDEGGALGAMQAEQWHKDRPGQRTIVPDAGDAGARSLDAMAQAAWQAGYFPEFKQAPSASDFLDAVRGEMRDRARHKADIAGARPWPADVERAASDLDALLARLDIDVKTVSNHEIRETLRRYEAEPGDYEQGRFRDDLFIAFGNRIKAILKNPLNLSLPRPEMPKTPHALKLAGAPDMPLIMRPDVVTKAVGLTKTSTGDRHAVPGIVLERLVDKLARPAAIFSSATEPDAQVVLLDDGVGREPIIAAIHHGNATVKFNRIQSVYDRQKGAAWIDEQVKAGRLRYMDTEKSKRWISQPASVLAGPGSNVKTEADLPPGRLYQTEGRVRRYDQAVRVIDDLLAGVASGKAPARADAIGHVSAWLVAEARAAGIEIEGYSHAIDISAIKHALKHGDAKAERRRGNLEVTVDDIRSIPALLDAPDAAIFGARGKRGQDVIGYMKTMPDGTHLYLEEKRSGREQLAALTLRKYPATTNVEAVASTQSPNVRNDGGNLKIVKLPSGSSAIAFDQSDTTYERVRGRIGFADGRTLIQLFLSRDPSTFLHETGHLWLEEMRRDAQSPDAPQQIRDDWARIEAYLGVRPGESLTVAQHETFARTVEAYLREGKAPSAELATIFARFKEWLIEIYRTARALDVPINDDIRRVLDRIVATDEQIAAASDNLRARPIFASAEQAGLTSAEFASYQRLMAGAHETADLALLRQIMAPERARRTMAWQAEADDLRREVAAAVDQRPDLNALSYLRTGTSLDGRQADGLPHLRLSRADIAPDVLAGLPELVHTQDGGAHPDALAEMLGFASGRELLDALVAVEAQQRALVAAGDTRSVREAAIADGVERIQRQRHGDMLSDGAIEQAAIDALHNEQRAQMLAVELRALGRKAGIEPYPLPVVQAWAQRSVAQKTVREAGEATLHLRSERRAARAAEAALETGDHREAYRHKQQQVASHLLYVEARAAADEIEAGRTLLERYASHASIASISQDHLDQIHGLLERLSLRTESLVPADKRQSLRAFAERLEGEGHDVAIAGEWLNEGDARPLMQRTLDEFRGVTDAVRQIAHIGRQSPALDAAITEAVAAADALRRAPRPPDARGTTEVQRRLGQPGLVLRSMDAALLKIETIVDWLDGGDANGPWNRHVFRPIADAQANARILQKQLLEGFGAQMQALPSGTAARWQESLVLPGLPNAEGRPTRLLRSELITAALNTGNEVNFAALLKGEGWDSAALQQALDQHLTRADWRFVRGVWDLTAALEPQIAALDRSVNGLAPRKVESRIVQTPDGSVRGGYYPLVHDPRSSSAGDPRVKAADGLIDPNVLRATAPRGFVGERFAGDARPLWLSLEMVPRHLVEIAHDLSFREPVNQVGRFLADPRVGKAIEGALGKDYARQFRPWLQAIANEWASDRRGVEHWDDFVKSMRTNATVFGLALRLPALLVRAGGYADATEYLGTRWMASGLRAFMADPVAAHRFVTAKSPDMAGRLATIDQHVRAQARTLLGESDIIANAQRFALYGIGMMDRVVTLPTWLGAYNKAMAQGMADADAVYAADKAVRTSQGAAGTKDLAAASRRSEYWRIAGMLYSYLSHLYQRQRTLLRDARDTQSVGDYAMIAARAFWLLVVPALFGAWASGQGPDDDEDVAAWALRKITFGLSMGLPVLRDLAPDAEKMIVGKPDDSAARASVHDPLARILKAAGTAAGQAVDGEVDAAFLRRAIELPGYVVGLPVGPAASAAQQLWDVLVVRDPDPRGIRDWLDGLARHSR